MSTSKVAEISRLETKRIEASTSGAAEKSEEQDISIARNTKFLQACDCEFQQHDVRIANFQTKATLRTTATFECLWQIRLIMRIDLNKASFNYHMIQKMEMR